MWWPSTLAQVSLFRALHEKETRPKWGLTRVQFFLIVLITSFSFYVVPGYFFPSLTALSFVCWIWKDSVTAQQLGSGWLGFGLGSFSLDWSLMSISLTTPSFALVNTLVGLVFVNHILTGIAYWSNLYEAKRFPVFSTDLFDASGQPYNISRILDENNLQFNEQGYNNYGPIYLSIRYAVNWGMSFAAIPATLCHAFLFYGKSIWRETNEAFRDKSGDVHIRIMKRNYDAIPQWWFHILLVLMIPISILACEGFGKQFQLPYWGVLLACAIAFIYIFPVGVIQATSNVWPGGIQEVTQLLISYIYPGRPIANMVFKAYGYTSTAQGLAFLQDFKLGHYMKIPPRSMFIVQLVSTVISCSVNVGTTWWFLTNVDNICHPEKLPKGSPWICPGDDMIYSESVLWGVAGARRIFGQLGLYSKLNFFFLVGLLAPVPAWAFSLLYPQKKWLRLIILPVILGAGGSMPPGRMAWWWTYLAVGFFFNFHVYRRFQGWWARHVYVLAAGSDAGIILLNLLAYFSVQAHGVYGVNWWGLAVNDHCHLAHCPTKPGIVVDGCPTH